MFQHRRRLKIVSISSPLLKCVLPGAPDVDTRFQQDSFNAKHTFDDQPRLAERAFEIARRTGAGAGLADDKGPGVDAMKDFGKDLLAIQTQLKKTLIGV